MTRATLLLLLLGACKLDIALPAVWPDAGPVVVTGNPILGPRGQIGFCDGDCFLVADRIIAQGSHVNLLGQVAATAPAPATFTSTDPSVLVIGAPAQLSSQHFQVPVQTKGAGDADVIVSDAAGVEIDRFTLHVRPSDELAFDHSWGAGNPLVLAGAVERFHVSTKTAGAYTAGTGAVKFTLGGALAPARPSDAPWLHSEGDQVFFLAGPSGQGTITASAANTAVTLTIDIVPASALTAVSADPARPVFTAGSGQVLTVTASAAGRPVFGVRCDWAAPAALQIQPHDSAPLWEGGFIDADEPGLGYGFQGPPGTYDATCTIPGGLALTIPIELD
jgi:hypothetical protein